MRVLVTGGAGFIGSHTVVELMAAGHEVVVLDNLANARRSVIDRIGEIAGDRPGFVEGDVRDTEVLGQTLESGFDACMHFAALKAVGESVAEPLAYYDNNVGGTVALLGELDRAEVRTFVFSSSATVYGDPRRLPLVETMPMGEATNPYGWTKIMMEQVLRDLNKAHPDWSMSLLRYFNPVGAHESGLIGEDPQGIPNNLMPYIARVAAGRLPKLQVYGGDYDTADGTGIRDYIHVVDLAIGHVRALEAHHDDPGVHTYNLGTGQGHSVLEVVKAYEAASGRPVPFDIVERRAGDVAANWADVAHAAQGLDWVAERDLDRMCADSWRWQQNAR